MSRLTQTVIPLFTIAALAASDVFAQSGLERYFPFSYRYNDPKITVRANDRATVETLSQSENPHLANGNGNDGTRRSYFLTTLTTARDIAGVFVDFADMRSTTAVRSISVIYVTNDGISFDCYNPTGFGKPLVTLATPMSAAPIPSSTVTWIKHCFTNDASSPGDSSIDVAMAKPRRLTTQDGTEIDVVDIAVKRNGTAWRTWHFGLNLGLVGITPHDGAAPFGFAAVSVPPPAVEAVVAEFWNGPDFPSSPGGHYFYTSDPAEQFALETGKYGAWGRTGRSFKSGGYVPVCRFYGSMRPGPNSHFFTGSAGECEGLKTLQRPNAQVPQWNYESLGFTVTLPRVGVEESAKCINGTIPVRRAYNNAFTASGRNAWDSNHRLSVSQADIDAVVRLGWKDEGIVFCVPL